MKRSIAKFLIQYFYDSNSKNTGHSDPLPRWLRNWIDRDVFLNTFEREFLQLQNQLVSQAEGHLANWRQMRAPAKLELFTLPKQSSFAKRNPIFLAALAAGLCCILLAAGWFVWHPIAGSQSQDSIAIKEFELNDAKTKETQRAFASLPRDQLVLSTWEATKRIASDFKRKSSHANQTLGLASQKELEKQIKEVSQEGLRFVTQKLPQATVRMLGMNSQRN